VLSREIRLKRRPEGLPREDDFEAAEVTLGALAPGAVRVRNRYLSTDPYMRGRMIDRPGYAAPFALGAAIPGRAIGTVVASDAAGFAPGDLVRSMAGWREAFDAPPEALEKLETHGIAPHHFIGAAGVPGLSAYAGLTAVAGLQAGETVFVSAASGAVGAVACQVAKLLGARVVGSAGGPEKAAYLGTIGVDAAIDYKAAKDLPAALAAAAPEGIDVYFDNVGGAHLEAAIGRMRPHGRIAICGMISAYNATGPVPGPSNLAELVGRSVRMEGFLTANHLDLMPGFVRQMAGWLESGAVRTRDTFYDGIDAAPAAFLSLFTGAHFGKPIVRLSP
jgi:NADPH-dependent curcumin reductase CurA